MSRFDFEVANNFDKAWLNFELDLPLQPSSVGFDHPFYVSRPNNQTDKLISTLLAPFSDPPKFFFTGHRGTGKSTELFRIANLPAINEKFWPVHYSIREETDLIGIEIQDILLSIGSRIYRSFVEKGYKLSPKLIKSIESLEGQVEVEVKKVAQRTSEFNISAGLDAFFAKTSLSMKMEPESRKVIRQILKPKKNDFVKIINEISLSVHQKTGRIPLVIIDDLDKPEFEDMKSFMKYDIDLILSLNCAFIGVIANTFSYSREFVDIWERSFVLSPVQLVDWQEQNQIYTPGYECMDLFISKRISKNLISQDAKEAIIFYSGGVNRELSRLARTSIGSARRKNREQVVIDDVEWAASEICNEYNRILDNEDRIFLKDFCNGGKIEDIRDKEKLSPLLQLLALLEYSDKDQKRYYQIHPVLLRLFVKSNSDKPSPVAEIHLDSSKTKSAELTTLPFSSQTPALGVVSETEFLAPQVKSENVSANKESRRDIINIDAGIQSEEGLKNAYTWYELGNVYFNSQEHDESINAYSKAIEINHEFALAYIKLGLVYQKKGRYIEAMLLIQRGIDLSKNNIEKALGWNNLGNIYRILRYYDKAMSAYQQADELDPDQHFDQK